MKKDISSIMLIGGTSEIGQEVLKNYVNNCHGIKPKVTITSRDTKGMVTKVKLEKELKIPVDNVFLDVNDEISLDTFWVDNEVPSVLIICIGTLGKEEHFNSENTKNVIWTNFTAITVLLDNLAHEKQKPVSIIVLSSVAGERGRYSNYEYGAAKAGLTQYLSGYRAKMLYEKVHVLTVKCGLVRTKMIVHKPKSKLECSPKKVGKLIYRAAVKKKDVVYVPAYWRTIMFIVRSIPERIFKKLTF